MHACMRVRLPRVRCVIPVETYHAEEMHAWGECTRMQHACGRARERERDGEAVSTATGKVNEMGEKERDGKTNGIEGAGRRGSERVGEIVKDERPSIRTALPGASETEKRLVA